MPAVQDDNTKGKVQIDNTKKPLVMLSARQNRAVHGVATCRMLSKVWTFTVYVGQV